MNKKYLSILAASVAAVSLFAGCGSDSADNKGAASEEKVLIVGTEPTFPPFEFTEDGKDVGFDIDLLQAISDKIGYKMEIKNLGFDALIPALKSGQIDLIAAGMDATEERKKQVDLPTYTSAAAIPSSSARTTRDITGYESLAGKTVGAQVGSRAASTPRNTARE